MNTQLETKTDQAEARRALFDELKLTMVATFVPFSRSRNAKPNPKPNDLQLNWVIHLQKVGFIFLVTDYSQGIRHIPGYQISYGGGRSTQNDFNILAAVCESGKATRKIGYGLINLPFPTIDDVLYSLVLDASAIDYRGFEDWAEGCGYETDSRKAEGIYRACLDIGLKLRAAVGNVGLIRLQEVFQDY